MTPADDDFPLRSAASGRFRFGSPRTFALLPEAEAVVFVRSEEPYSPTGDLWYLNIATGEEYPLVTVSELVAGSADVPEAEQRRRERLREGGAGITSYSVDDAGRTAVFALAGDLWLAPLDDGSTPTRLDVPAPVVDPRISPDGSKVAWLSGSQVWWAPVEKPSAAVPLTVDDGATWGAADFIAAEELNRHRGFWWSPDSSQLLVCRVDDSEVTDWWIADPAFPETQPVRHAYPAAGRRNALVSVWLMDLDGQGVRVLSVGPGHEDEYLAAVSWPSRGALLQTLSRDQRRTTVYGLEGSEVVSKATWSDPHWVDVVPGSPTWDHHGRLLTVRVDPEADRMRVFADEHPISPSDLQIRSLLGAVNDAVVVLTAPTPTTCRVAEITSHGTHVHTPASRATDDVLVSGGWHTGYVEGDFRLDVNAGIDDETWTFGLRRASGEGWEQLAAVKSHAAKPGVDPQPELFDVGDIQVAVLQPRGLEVQHLPVLMMPYGGPHSQRVMAAGAAFIEAQWWADQGYLVVVADGRGTPGVSPSWERAVAGDLLHPALEDQVTALDAALERFAGDPERVGITGWSFGGYLAAAAVLAAPDRFHAAIAGAPVTDWRWYDTAYSERYLGRPDEDAEAYDRSSLIPLAPQLRRPLMLIHGLADDNVVAAHTLRLSAALVAAGRPHQVLPLTHVTHMASDPAVAANLLRFQKDFFAAHLQA